MFSFYCEHKLKTKLKCQLDTGATCNVLSYRDLSIIKQDGDHQMESSKTKLKFFYGSLMKPLGEVNLQVTHSGQAQVLKFQVVSDTNKRLLFAETCQKLGLLKLGSQTEVITLDVKQAPLASQSILQDYQDVFKGLGHIGTGSFVVDLSAIPVQHTSRRIALKKEVKAKLEDLERRGIIVKKNSPGRVDMVVLAEPKKIRICFDPQELNKVIQLPKYLMPTLEELLPKLCKAEANSTLITFWTPLGRHLRMPFGVRLLQKSLKLPFWRNWPIWKV